jgi:hypothetical protein
MTLSIHFNGQEDTNDLKDEISWWSGQLKEAFEQLEVGDVVEKGSRFQPFSIQQYRPSIRDERVCHAL